MLRRIVLLCHFIKKLFVVGNVISRLNQTRKYLCYCRPKSLNVWVFFPFHLFDAGCTFFYFTETVQILLRPPSNVFRCRYESL